MNTQRKFTQVILIIVAIILLAAFVSTARSEELYNYKVTGQNKQTGLVVIGHVWESDRQGNLTAKIYDEMTIQDACNGAWIGHGVAQVGCGNGYQYILKVVEK